MGEQVRASRPSKRASVVAMDLGLFLLMALVGTLGAAIGMRLSRVVRRKRRDKKGPPGLGTG